jgi:hypothetical protein
MVCGGWVVKSVVNVEVIEVMRVWICGGKRVRVVGAAFSLLVEVVEFWLEGSAFVSWVGGDEEVG